jgi:hypothetical protein
MDVIIGDLVMSAVLTFWELTILNVLFPNLFKRKENS